MKEKKFFTASGDLKLMYKLNNFRMRHTQWQVTVTYDTAAGYNDNNIFTIIM